MAKLNIYRIDEEKKDEFLENLKEKLNILNNKKIENENGKQYLFTLYTFFPNEEKSLSWNWLLNEFDENSFKYVATPKAIVTIEESNIMYVITFGSSYFLVDKFCDRKFAFEFAKRSEYKDIKTTALNSPNSLKNKVINSYNKCSELIYDSGESYSKIKASMKTQEEETRFNGTIEIGTSIKFSMKENTLENIIKIIEYVEETLEKEIIHNIPLFLEVDKFRVEELDKKLIENITQGNTNVKFAEFDIIGTNEIFYNNDTKMKICYGKNAEETEEINCEKLNNFISTYKVEHSNVLDIKIEFCNEEGYSFFEPLKNLIDYTDDDEKVIISKGSWYEYNNDYLKYLEDSISELDIEYNQEYDKFDKTYEEYIIKQYDNEVGNPKYSGMNKNQVIAELKKVLYREKVFNMLMEEKYGYENYDRNLKSEDGNKYELMDLYKDKTMYTVKIGSSSSKLCYMIDQSLIGMKMIKTEKKQLDIEKVGIWILLERRKKLAKKRRKNRFK